MTRVIGRSLVGVIAAVFLFAIAMYFLTWGNYTVARTVDDDPSLPVIEANGYRFHGEVLGDPGNPTIIVLHGGPGSDYLGQRYLDPLADAYQLVYFDQRGAGLSPRVEAFEISLEIYLEDLNALVDKFGQGRPVILIGPSWGGEYAVLYTARYPKKVAKLALLEPGELTAELNAVGADRDLSFKHSWMFIKAMFQALHMDAPDAYADEDYVFGEIATNTNLDYFCDKEIPPNYSGLRAGMIAHRVIREEVRSVNAEDGTFDLSAGIEAFPNKVLFLAGECDLLLGPEMQREQMKLFPNAELVALPDAGHEIYGEDATLALNALREYFAE